MSENQVSQDRKPANGCWKSCSIVIGVVIALFGLWLVIAIGSFMQLENQWHHLTLQRVSQFCDVKFPASAKLKNSRADGWIHSQGYQIYAKIEMDKKDLKQFIANVHVNNSDTEDSAYIRAKMERMGSKDILDWWKPGSAKKYIAIDSYIHVLVDLDGSPAVIYIYRSR